MKKSLVSLDMLIVVIILLMTIITVAGVRSFNTDMSYVVKNQYEQNIRIFGSGIYAHDSYFRAPIFIGSDFTMLFFVVPMLTIALIRKIRHNSVGSRLFITSVLGAVLYYATSVAFGVVYNSYQLLYIALFACSLFAFIQSIRKMDLKSLRKVQSWKIPSKGVRVFLIMAGIALFVAWLPDIIPTIITGNTLPLIEVYTTEITYVLDMGIISPIMFICLYLLKKKDGLGDLILASILTLCTIIGIMLPIQTVYQSLAGIDTPIPVLITKIGIFVILASFAMYFNVKLFRFISMNGNKPE